MPTIVKGLDAVKQNKQTKHHSSTHYYEFQVIYSDLSKVDFHTGGHTHRGVLGFSYTPGMLHEVMMSHIATS